MSAGHAEKLPPRTSALEVRTCTFCGTVWTVETERGHAVESSHYVETPAGTMFTGTTRECPTCHWWEWMTP